jgi:hypothetical protein
VFRQLGILWVLDDIIIAVGRNIVLELDGDGGESTNATARALEARLSTDSKRIAITE